MTIKTKTQEKYEKEVYQLICCDSCTLHDVLLGALQEQAEELSKENRDLDVAISSGTIKLNLPCYLCGKTIFIRDGTIIKKKPQHYNCFLNEALSDQKKKFEEVLDEFIKDILNEKRIALKQNSQVGFDVLTLCEVRCKKIKEALTEQDILSPQKSINQGESEIRESSKNQQNESLAINRSSVEDKTPSPLTNPSLDGVSRIDEDRGSKSYLKGHNLSEGGNSPSVSNLNICECRNVSSTKEKGIVICNKCGQKFRWSGGTYGHWEKVKAQAGGK